MEMLSHYIYRVVVTVDWVQQSCVFTGVLMLLQREDVNTLVTCQNKPCSKQLDL